LNKPETTPPRFPTTSATAPGRRGDLLKILLWDGQGLILIAKRLEKGKFVWPQASNGVVSLTPAMLSMLLEGIDWRMPAWTARPEVVG
jgi:transposase